MSTGRTGTPATVLVAIAFNASVAAAFPGVAVAPGATELTLTPRGPNSAAHVRVICSMAALDAVYIAPAGIPTRDIHDPIFHYRAGGALGHGRAQLGDEHVRRPDVRQQHSVQVGVGEHSGRHHRVNTCVVDKNVDVSAESLGRCTGEGAEVVVTA